MHKSDYLGIDTSNYTTSAALLFESEIRQSKMLLPVKQGDAGLRQSDAVFHHVRQLPNVLDSLLPANIRAVGVSNAPRNVESSYMPCFLVGAGMGESLARAMGVKCHSFSHQQGHIAAALFSAGRQDLTEGDFIAFHLSGGTSEGLLVRGGVLGSAEIISRTLDISAGQAIDRVGVSLGLRFPAGKALQELADSYDGEIKGIKPFFSGLDFSLSGVQNKCEKKLKDGVQHSEIAAFCLEYVIKTVERAAELIAAEYPSLPMVFSGGVASNSSLKTRIKKRFEAEFALPEFSCDNAAGIAVLAKYVTER